MNNLPTQSRIFGVVHVNTATEHAGSVASHRRDYLKIQVSRDRLVDNLAFDQLRDAVRWSLDYYAMEETRRKLREAETRKPPEPRKSIARVGKTLDANRGTMPAPVYSALRDGLRDVSRAASAESQVHGKRIGVLGALATAGITTLAYDRQLARELDSLRNLAQRIAQEGASKATAKQAATELKGWIQRVSDARALFQHLADDDHRRQKMRFRARGFIEDVRDHMLPLLAGASVDVSGVGANVRLPEGTHAEWTAVFQNVLMNAGQAMAEAESREIVVNSRAASGVWELLFQDTGSGVDLAKAERLFEPFVRGSDGKKQNNKPQASGLGLTVVRMLASELGAVVSFVRPDAGFTTAFRLAWPDGE